jgi:hypothetical protein
MKLVRLSLYINSWRHNCLPVMLLRCPFFCLAEAAKNSGRSLQWASPGKERQDSVFNGLQVGVGAQYFGKNRQGGASK